MDQEHIHITEYSTLGKVLILLLILATLSVGVAWFDLQQLTIIVAMVIACVKVYIVLIKFMHLQFEKMVFKLMVRMVFLVIAVIFILLFADYWFR